MRLISSSRLVSMEDVMDTTRHSVAQCKEWAWVERMIRTLSAGLMLLPSYMGLSGRSVQGLQIGSMSLSFSSTGEVALEVA